MFIAVLFITAKMWKQAMYPSTDEWIKRCDIYIYIYAIKNNEILPFVAMWMDLENTMFSEVSQTEKDKYCMISLMWNLKKVKLVSITQKRLTWGIPWWSSWLGFSIFTAVGQGSILG